MVRFLLIGDLHGVKPNIYFGKEKFDAIIVIGDIASDEYMRPYIDEFISINKDGIVLPNMSLLLMTHGIDAKKEMELDKKALRVGNNILTFLSTFGKPIFMIPGNWDDSYGKTDIDKEENTYSRTLGYLESYLGEKINPLLTKGVKNLHSCQYKTRTFKGVNIIGYGLSSGPEHPGVRKKKYSDKETRKIHSYAEKLSMKLERVYKKRNKNLPTIFLSHNVPYKTNLDKVLKKDSWASNQHYGSTVARKFILKNKPLVSISGHMHEYYGKIKLGKTTVLNVGFGAKVNTLLDIDEKKGIIRNITFINNDKRKDVNRKVGW